MKKERDVVMIATDKHNAPIIKQLDTLNHLILTSNYDWSLTCDWEYQHLYILSDEDIKEGDWYYREGMKSIDYWDVDGSGIMPKDKYCKKIIATSDTELWTKSKIDNSNCFKNSPIPQIPQWYIEYYIEQYNSSNIESNNMTITKVMVEYEAIGRMKSNGIKTPIIELLKLSDDNCIIIHKTKDTWNREEVEQLLYTLSKDIAQIELRDVIPNNYLQEWININL